MSLTIAGPDDPLDSLADHCLAARAIIGETNSPVMTRLIDLLLYEVGVALASRSDGGDGFDCEGQA